jgi:hypothetical protein
MKITKSRLLEIIKEEVALYTKSKQQSLYEFNVVDLMEMLNEEPADKDDDGQISKKEFQKIVDSEEERAGLEEVEQVKHKGKTYKASASTMKAIRGGGGGPGKVTPAEFKKAVDQAKSWADDPEAVAAAGRLIAKKKAGTMEESDVEEDKLLDPETKEPLNKHKKPKH